MNIDELTVGQAKQIASMLGTGSVASHPWKIGTAYLIRTVTNYWTGRLAEVHSDAIVLSGASWIADTGRFHTAVMTGVVNEVEPVPNNVIVGRGAIVDATEWRHALPRDKK